jgi:Pyridoxamine 5'-phosphate oxidase
VVCLAGADSAGARRPGARRTAQRHRPGRTKLTTWDPVRHTGWSVIATGTARLVRDPAAAARYQQLLEPWVDRPMDHVIAITPQIITGIRLVGWCS